jgi:hypothetical protein
VTGHQASLPSRRRGGARQIRVVFVNTHPIQYFAPLYADLNRTGDLSVTALYLSDYSVRGANDRGFEEIVKWDVDLLAGYKARFVRGAARRGETAGFFLCRRTAAVARRAPGRVRRRRRAWPHAGRHAGRSCRREDGAHSGFPAL